MYIQYKRLRKLDNSHLLLCLPQKTIQPISRWLSGRIMKPNHLHLEGTAYECWR